MKKFLKTILLIFSLQFFITFVYRIYFFFSFADQTETAFNKTFFLSLIHGLRFDLSALTYLNALLILALLCNFKKVILKSLWTLFTLVYTTLLFTNYFYYSVYSKNLTYDIIKIVTGTDLNILFAILKTVYLLLFIVLFISLYFLFNRLLPSKIDLKLTHRVLTGFVVLVVSVLAGRGGLQKRVLGIQHTWLFSSGKAFYASLTSNPVHNLLRMKRGAYIPKHFIKESKKNNMFFENRSNSVEIPKKPQNVLFIFVESLSSYALENNYSKELLDWINKNDQDLFTTNHFYANSFLSKGALISVLYGVPSYFDLQFFESKYSGIHVSGLGHVAADNNLKTFLLDAGPSGTQFFDTIAKGANLDEYASLFENNPVEKNQRATWGIHDKLFYKKSIDYISNLKKEKFIGVLFTASSHYPFKGTPNNPNGAKDIEEDYKLSIDYAGQSLVNFLEKVKNETWFSNTLIAILGDHTPPIPSGWARKKEDILRVPLILYQKNSNLSEVSFKKTGSQIDLPLTVFDLLDLKAKQWTPFGSSLLNKKRDFSFTTRGQNVYIMKESGIREIPIHKLNTYKDEDEDEDKDEDKTISVVYNKLLDYIYRLENNALYKKKD